MLDASEHDIITDFIIQRQKTMFIFLALTAFFQTYVNGIPVN